MHFSTLDIEGLITYARGKTVAYRASLYCVTHPGASQRRLAFATLRQANFSGKVEILLEANKESVWSL